MEKIVILTLCLFVGPFQAVAKIIPPRAYDFPNIRSIDATIGTAAVGRLGVADKIKSVKVHRHQRDYRDSRLSAAEAELRFRVFFPKKASRRLVFVLAGVGGDHLGGISNSLASGIAAQGAYAVVVPSVFYAPFAIYGSRDGFVGDMLMDSYDLYTLMQQGLKKIRQRYGIKADRLSLMGYSLGGLTAGFLGKIDHTQRKFNFDKVLLLDPVVDLAHGTRLIDEYRAQKKKILPLDKLSTFLQFRKKSKQYQVNAPSLEGYMGFQNFVSKLPLVEKQFAVGYTLHGPLKSIVLYAESWKKRKRLTPLIADLPEPPAEEDFGVGAEARRRQFVRAQNTTYQDYTQNHVVKLCNLVGRPMTVESLAKRNSLYSLQSYLSSNSKVHLIHNADDMWLRGPQEVRRLNKIFGDRALIYPRGGHMGNYWYPENWQATLSVIL